MASNNESRGGVGGLSRPGLTGARSRRRDASGPVNDAEAKGEYRYGHGDSITEVRGLWSAGHRVQVRRITDRGVRCGWVPGDWVTGDWVTGDWVTGRRVAGGWVTGDWVAGGWVTGRRVAGG